LTITAKVVADSMSCQGKRITTLELRYPRFIHAEFMTHRQFSRNASSSRAIPVKRLIEDVLTDPAMPIHWGKNQPGMQAREEHDAPVVFRNDSVSPQAAWLRARDVAVGAAEQFDKAGFHKQIVNRLLEPFAHINVIVTATDWDNFFKLRLHPDAQPEIHQLAIVMFEAMANSAPLLRAFQGWHLPYIGEADMKAAHYNRDKITMISAARCARVSYKTHDGGDPDWQKDLKLAEDLLGDGHMSPFEHQATPAVQRFANFDGWRSNRSILEGNHQ
jgi:hypothetical protein